MGRPKNEKYEYIPERNLYRKRLKDRNGKKVALTAKSPEQLSEKIARFHETQRDRSMEDKNPLVNDAIQYWFDNNLGNISNETRKDYQSIVNVHIKPYMDGKRMLDVLPGTISEIISKVSKHSASVHNKTYMLLKRFFTSAFENGDIPFNPCPLMHNGGTAPKEKAALTNQQVEILMTAIKGTPAFLFCMIALLTGLRTEEILGLQWDCVHLSGTPTIEVKRACRWSHNRPAITERLKSPAARRTVPIPKRLKEHLVKGKASTSSAFVIHNNANLPLTKSEMKSLWDNVRRRQAKDRVYYRYKDGKKEAYVVKAEFGKKAKRGGLFYTIDFEVTPHMLRHTYITNLLLGGMDIKKVQYLAGHEKSKVTLDIYAHLVYNKPEELLEKVHSAFSKEEKGKSPTSKS